MTTSTAVSTLLRLDTPVAPAIQAMSTWKSEQWHFPTQFDEFPILEICPDAPGYFASAGHFSNRDLKKIAGILGEQFDLTKSENLYLKLIVKLESNPWVFALLETEVVRNRNNKRRSKKSNQVFEKKVLSKLPLSNLRLRSCLELHDKVDELLLSNVDPALAVAAFCEYAIMNYQHLIFGIKDDKELSERANEILSGSDQVDYVEGHDLPEEKSGYDFGQEIPVLLNTDPNSASDHTLRSLHVAIKSLVDKIEVGSLLEDSRIAVLGNLALHTQSIHKTLADKAARLTVDRLRDLGVFSENKGHVRYALEPATVLLTEQFYRLILQRSKKIDDINSGFNSIKQKIYNATNKEDFGSIVEFTSNARELKQKLVRMRMAYDSIIMVFKSLVDETPDRFISLVEGLDLAQDSDIFEENFELNDFLKLFEQHRHESVKRSRNKWSNKNDILFDPGSGSCGLEGKIEVDNWLGNQCDNSISNGGFQVELDNPWHQSGGVSVMKKAEIPVVSGVVFDSQSDSEISISSECSIVEGNNETHADADCNIVEDIKTKIQHEENPRLHLSYYKHHNVLDHMEISFHAKERSVSRDIPEGIVGIILEYGETKRRVDRKDDPADRIALTKKSIKEYRKRYGDDFAKSLEAFLDVYIVVEDDKITTVARSKSSIHDRNRNKRSSRSSRKARLANSIF